MKRNTKRGSSAPEEVSHAVAVQASCGPCVPPPNRAVTGCRFGATYADDVAIHHPHSGVDPVSAAIKDGIAKTKREFRAQGGPPPAAADQSRVNAVEGGVSAETGLFLRHPHLGLDPVRLQAFALLDTAQLMSMATGIAQLMVVRFGKFGLPYTSARPLVINAGTLTADALRVNAFGRDIIGPALDDLIALEYTFQRRVDAADAHLRSQVSATYLSQHILEVLFNIGRVQGSGE